VCVIRNASGISFGGKLLLPSEIDVLKEALVIRLREIKENDGTRSHKGFSARASSQIPFPLVYCRGSLLAGGIGCAYQCNGGQGFSRLYEACLRVFLPIAVVDAIGGAEALWGRRPQGGGG
jgi:hypothetical protein